MKDTRGNDCLKQEMKERKNNVLNKQKMFKTFCLKQMFISVCGLKQV